ncbi:hypothetical protein PPYR_01633 [Photinus pyralis]|uniref:Chitin-binding type-2 domain-containing protein n=1 Tax=Photinus pyralis TaxID=7054 RepID=A0A5N4B542_PHOPY|nr:hypothetical protein PPYR_01633 [Photinus pyralis]
MSDASGSRYTQTTRNTDKDLSSTFSGIGSSKYSHVTYGSEHTVGSSSFGSTGIVTTASTSSNSIISVPTARNSLNTKSTDNQQTHTYTIYTEDVIHAGTIGAGSQSRDENKTKMEDAGTTIPPTRGIEIIYEGEIRPEMKCSSTGKFRYMNSCKQYYYCDRIPHSNSFLLSRVRECQICMQFNAKLGRCDYPENVPECQPDNGIENRLCTGDGNFSIPKEKNCRKYYECIKDVSTDEIRLNVKECASGTTFNAQLQRCVPGEHCKRHRNPRCTGRNYNFFDRHDCTSYYHCDHRGYVFNGEECEWKDDVICDPDALTDKDLERLLIW